MALTNTRARYGSLAQILHWTTAFLILILLPLGIIMTWLPAGTADQVALKIWLYSLHKTLGVTVFAVAIIRVIWALVSTRPVPLHPERKLETFAAETVHWMLYGAIILAPLTGLLHHAASTGFAPIWWPFGQDLPFIPKSERLAIATGYAHWGIAITLVGSLLLHISGALKHQFIDRDLTLARMLPFGIMNSSQVLPARNEHKNSYLPSFVAALVLFGFTAGATTYGDRVSQPKTIIAQAEQPSDASDFTANWAVDDDQSTLGVTISQLGSPVEGAFADWNADIFFDTNNLSASKVNVTINTASLAIGTVSKDAIGPDFLNSEAYDTAVFEANNFELVSANNYIANGTLTIRGASAPLALPFMLTIDGDAATMSGQVSLNRMDFGVGAEKYGSEDSVGFDVNVTIAIQAKRID